MAKNLNTLICIRMPLECPQNAPGTPSEYLQNLPRIIHAEAQFLHVSTSFCGIPLAFFVYVVLCFNHIMSCTHSDASLGWILHGYVMLKTMFQITTSAHGVRNHSGMATLERRLDVLALPRPHRWCGSVAAQRWA